MDIYKVIESDHALTRGLIDRISSARNPEWRYQLCRELLQVTHVHGKALTTALKDVLASPSPMAPRLAQAQESYGIAEDLLKEALSLNPEAPDFMRLFNEARAELDHEVKVEENIILEFARCILDDAQALKLGQRMRMLKDDYIETAYMGSPSLRADAGYYS